MSRRSPVGIIFMHVAVRKAASVKIAVVQHALRATPAQDLEALVAVSATAASAGADIVVLPEVTAVREGPLGDELWRRLEDVAPDAAVIWSRGAAEGPETAVVAEVPPLGATALLSGDACMDPQALTVLLAETPEAAILAPRSESELQAQAVLELAIGLSTSLASLVVIAEPAGSDLGEPGHGGSAIIHLGEVLAEAVAADDLLLAEVPGPLGAPEPKGPLPVVPPLLVQRLAAHRGQKVAVDYPADLD
ncbi:MAG: hypothetical protein ISP10_07210 [Aeromicrobium sp.]|nr:hypothetical protein [Aeromicrobium sp.]